MAIFGRGIYFLILRFFPVLILFVLVLVDFDFSFDSKKFITINIAYIVIYFWVLKHPDILGHGLVFFAGIINDVVMGLPIGISSINYLILSGIASYFRNITLRSSLINEWIAFLPTVLIINSVHYSILSLVFEIKLNYYYLILTSFLTVAVYPLFAILFSIISKRIKPIQND